MDGTEVSDRRFSWSGAEICAERTPAGTVTKRFFPQGVEVASGPTAGAYLYTLDHLGSVRELTDGGGTIRARFTYDLFGRRTGATGDLNADFGFAGMFWAAAADLNLTLYRAYDPTVGRWLSRDPLAQAEFEAGTNLYVYAGNDPVGRRDPFGLCCESEVVDLQLAAERLRIDAEAGSIRAAEIIAAEWVACAAGLLLTPLGAALACVAAALAAATALEVIQNGLSLDRAAQDAARRKLELCIAKGCMPCS